MKIKYELTCAAPPCENSFVTEVDLPDGWMQNLDECYDECNGLCPEHANLADFFDKACDGCTNYFWGSDSCPLQRKFAFSRPTITEDDFAILETGKCPARVNGSFKLSPTTGIQEVDYSSPSVQGGKMLAEEIRKYLVKYAEELK
jgi:hypothetical protein